MMNDIYIAEAISIGAGIIIGIFFTLAGLALAKLRTPHVEPPPAMPIQTVIRKI